MPVTRRRCGHRGSVRADIPAKFLHKFLQFRFCLPMGTVYQIGNVKKCAVGKHPKSEKLGGIGSGCRLRLRPLPVLRRRQSQRVARIDPNAVVVDKNIAENDRFDLFSR